MFWTLIYQHKPKVRDYKSCPKTPGGLPRLPKLPKIPVEITGDYREIVIKILDYKNIVFFTITW